MPTAPEESSTEGVFVAATKARPATEEPVKRTAAKTSPAPAKKAPAKATNGAAKKAPAKAAKAATATKTRAATKGAAAKAAPARGRSKKATTKGADDAEATTTDLETDEQDLDTDAELDADPEIDLAQLAQAQGAQGFGPITDGADLAATFRRAIEAVEGGAVVVVDVRVAPGYAPAATAAMLRG